MAHILGKKLHVFDSFEGLPEAYQSDIKDFHMRRSSEWTTEWTQGRYAMNLEQVKKNIETYGELSACSFYKGWFHDTLTAENLPDKICLTFTDVDIASSARECLIALWPRLTDGGIYFSHDVGFIKVLHTLLDKDLWSTHFKEYPPILYVAGFGMSDASAHLGFFVKGKSISPEYLNKITIDK